jgi:BASS family bile acid:Na+ symporter
MPNIVYRSLFLSSLLFLAGFVISWMLNAGDLPGLLLTVFFVVLAISFYGYPDLKKFAYTVWIFAAVTVSMNYPEFFRQVGDFELQRAIVPLLQIIMFGMGSQLSIKNFADVIKMPRGVFVGIACQFTIMPILGISIATVFGFPPEIAAGIVLVGSSPSGLASNVMSFIARANLALSVTLTAVATLMAPLMTPLLMKLLAGQYVPIDFWNMMLSIINIVILPIVAGLMFNAIGYGLTKRRSIVIQALVYLAIIVAKNFLNYQVNDVTFAEFLSSSAIDIVWFSLLPIAAALVFRHYARGRKGWLDKAMSLVSMVGIAVIITIITAAGRDSLMAIGLALIVACLIHNLAGYFLGYWGCRLLSMDEQSCRTIAFEVGMQNGGLASGIALEMGKVATIGLAPAVFGPMMNVTGSSLATWWRGKTEQEPSDAEAEISQPDT